jgi:hypothetical protein
VDVEITELEKIDAERVDGVRAPASGIPILLMKTVAPVGVAKGARNCPKCEKTYDADHEGATCENCGTKLPAAPAAKSLPDWHADAVALVKKAMVRGKVDESADIDGGQQAIALLGKLIGYEAQELAAGNLGEVADIGLLADAAGLLRQWVSGESAVQDGNVMPATALMQSAADGDYKKYADSLFAPINDEMARLRAQLDVAKASPPDDDGDAAKSAIAQDGATVDTVTQETGGLTKAVEEAVAKATAPLSQEIADLRSAKDLALAELAKVKATPVPGGPMMSVVRPAKAADGDDHAAKAIRYEQHASTLADPREADLYRQAAAQERAKITTS